MKNELFAIGIPTINRADLLNFFALKRYVDDFPETDIYVIDNGNQQIMEHPRIHTFKAPENYGVAKSWNYLCERVFDIKNSEGCRPYLLMLNDDIYLGRKEWEIKDLIFRSRNHEELIVNSGPWCSFIMPAKVYMVMGKFDETYYPAYFEDNDYAYRLKLAGMSFYPTAALAPVEFRQSMSVAKDKTLNNGFEPNKQYYIKKWGGMPGEETYTTPFNI
jgi:GT2 family glycosyltransferase